MPWTSKYNARFTKDLVRQLVAIAQRDQRAALDFVGDVAGELAGFQSYLIADTPLQQFPSLLITPMDTAFDRDAAGSLHSVSKILVGVAVSHQDRARLAELLQDYVRAVDAIFNSLDLADLYQAWPLALPHLGDGATTTPLDAGTVKDLFIESHSYDEIRKRGASFSMAAVLTLIIDREET
jgi:hypothetical protein